MYIYIYIHTYTCNIYIHSHTFVSIYLYNTYTGMCNIYCTYIDRYKEYKTPCIYNMYICIYIFIYLYIIIYILQVCMRH